MDGKLSPYIQTLGVHNKLLANKQLKHDTFFKLIFVAFGP